MRSFDGLQTRFIRFLPAAALIAALFVPLLSASADEGCPPSGCPLPPPQSREVNPAPAHADGSAVEVPPAGGSSPIEITTHVLALPFVEPAPLTRSFAAISIPLRTQDPGDVSCGVQALGMALDGLPGAAPTSQALLGFLQDNGMMYDFGTGVEELAYAAQSFGYKGSFSFHDASIDELQSQLAAGNPVVVSLGANGEGAPGHFVTVTGFSSDGRWVSYNDPTMGEQQVLASEFSRLWALQGSSGVSVASDPPPGATDAGLLALWVAFAAGLMALVSTTPLGAFRAGIGGRLDAGPGSHTSRRSGSKASSRTDPPGRDKVREPRRTKARFDNEITMPPIKPLATRPRFDAEPPPPPKPTQKTKPRFDEEPIPAPSPPAYPEARFDQQAPPPRVSLTARFDEERDPEPTKPSAVLEPRFDDEPLPPPVYPVARFDEEEVPSQGGDFAEMLREILGWANWLFGLGRKLDAARDVSIQEVEGTLRVYGPQRSREVLGFRKTVNWTLPENESLILQTTGSQALGALTSPGMPIGLATNIVTDGSMYLSGEYDNAHLAAALTVDTGVTIGSAMVAGAIGGAFAGFLVGGALGFGVGAVPAAIAGAVAGALVAAGLMYAFKETGAREFVIDSVASMYGDWTGQNQE